MSVADSLCRAPVCWLGSHNNQPFNLLNSGDNSSSCRSIDSCNSLSSSKQICRTLGSFFYGAYSELYATVAEWRNGNIVGRINEVNLRRARFVLDKPPRYFTKPSRPTQPPTLCGTGNEYQPKCGDALRLGSKGRYGSFHL